MELNPKSFEPQQVANSNMILLDYFIGEGEGLEAYQLVRFSRSEVWNVLCDGFLLGSLKKKDGKWLEDSAGNLSKHELVKIGDFIDRQHFNSLPYRIKEHWEEYVEEVIMQTDSEYLVVTIAGSNFERFEKMFRSFISELIEDSWPIHFKVYDSGFEREFEMFGTQKLRY
ncbi:hypothetical protein [Pedobacter sp. Leaf250]|uniref:hypothetical protein n=1 Tax=Pedobacter sp. Leaf250 TaxID=2876559 RepID=UPI001E412602|nr:hypothetical protein [Pedobacter sp. Leaf250]